MVTPVMARVNCTAGEVPPKLSLTVTLNVEDPVLVGVPLMVPLDAFKVSPAGSDPRVTTQLLYGACPPEAVRVLL